MGAGMLAALLAAGCTGSDGDSDAVAAAEATEDDAESVQGSVDLACGTLLDGAADTMGTVMEVSGNTRALNAAFDLIDGQLVDLADALADAGWHHADQVALVAREIPDGPSRTYADTLMWLDQALDTLEDIGVECVDQARAG